MAACPSCIGYSRALSSRNLQELVGPAQAADCSIAPALGECWAGRDLTAYVHRDHRLGPAGDSSHKERALGSWVEGGEHWLGLASGYPRVPCQAWGTRLTCVPRLEQVVTRGASWLAGELARHRTMETQKTQSPAEKRTQSQSLAAWPSS